MNDDKYGKQNKGRHNRILSVKQTNRVSDSQFVRSDRFIIVFCQKIVKTKLRFGNIKKNTRNSVSIH